MRRCGLLRRARSAARWCGRGQRGARWPPNPDTYSGSPIPMITGGGARPHPMAWTKTLAGWATVEEWHTKRTRYRLGRAEGAAALRIPLAPSRALFVEARLRLGFDAILPTEGVLLSVADEGKTEGRGPLRVIGPDRPHDPAQAARFGAHWNAALQPGERYTCQGYAVEVIGRTNDAYDIEVPRA